MTQAGREGATAAQLRHDIDSGRTGDKVPVEDPAAAPLGTDDEAGGNSPSPQALQHARQLEGARQQKPPGPQRGIGAAWVLVGFCVVFGAMLILAAAVYW
ncbi:MAG: hypothetical protein ACJ8F3_17250 [Xanthobacteraceae bacterium]